MMNTKFVHPLLKITNGMKMVLYMGLFFLGIIPITSQTTSCTDGIQNEDETGVDCGGSCNPCAVLGCDTVTVIYRPDESMSKDGRIFSRPDSRDLNYPNTTSLAAVAWTWNSVRGNFRSLIDFPIWRQELLDLEVINVNLSLKGFPRADEREGDNRLSIHQITEDWDESTVTWNNSPSYDAAVAINYPATIGTEDVLLDVKDILRNSWGLLIKLSTEGIYRYRGLHGSASTESLKRPELIVTYVGNVSNTSGDVIEIRPGDCQSCSDGIQNGDETGTDCGGSCPPCETISAQLCIRDNSYRLGLLDADESLLHGISGDHNGALTFKTLSLYNGSLSQSANRILIGSGAPGAVDFSLMDFPSTLPGNTSLWMINPDGSGEYKNTSELGATPTNGLTNLAGGIGLGGTLNQSTIIDGNNQFFLIQNIGAGGIFGPLGSEFGINAQGNIMLKNGINSGASLTIHGDQELVLSSASSVRLSSPEVRLQTAPPQNNTEDAILVRNSTTGAIEQRDASTLSSTPSNGLELKPDGSIGLGGTIDNQTLINGNNQIIAFTNVSGGGFAQKDGGSMGFTDGNLDLLSGTGTQWNTKVFGAGSLALLSSTVVKIDGLQVTLEQTPPQTTTEDAILVRNATTGALEVRDAATLFELLGPYLAQMPRYDKASDAVGDAALPSGSLFRLKVGSGSTSSINIKE